MEEIFGHLKFPNLLFYLGVVLIRVLTRECIYLEYVSNLYQLLDLKIKNKSPEVSKCVNEYLCFNELLSL